MCTLPFHVVLAAYRNSVACKTLVSYQTSWMRSWFRKLQSIYIASMHHNGRGACVRACYEWSRHSLCTTLSLYLSFSTYQMLWHPIGEVFLEEVRIKSFSDVRMAPVAKNRISWIRTVNSSVDHYIHDPTKKDDIPSELAVEFVVFRGYVAKIISHCATLKGKKIYLLFVSMGSSRKSLSFKISGGTSGVAGQDSA